MYQILIFSAFLSMKSTSRSTQVKPERLENLWNKVFFWGVGWLVGWLAGCFPMLILMELIECNKYRNFKRCFENFVILAREGHSSFVTIFTLWKVQQLFLWDFFHQSVISIFKINNQKICLFLSKLLITRIALLSV